jgi:hypothetical protein
MAVKWRHPSFLNQNRVILDWASRFLFRHSLSSPLLLPSSNCLPQPLHADGHLYQRPTSVLRTMTTAAINGGLTGFVWVRSQTRRASPLTRCRPGGYSRKEIGQGLHWVPSNYCLRRMSFRVGPGSNTEQLRLRLPVAAIRQKNLLLPFLSQLFRHGINIEAEQLSVCLDCLRDESHWQIIRIASFHFSDDCLFALRRYHAVL